MAMNRVFKHSLFLIVLFSIAFTMVGCEGSEFQFESSYKLIEEEISNTKQFILRVKDEDIDKIKSQTYSLFITIEGRSGQGSWTITADGQNGDESQDDKQKIAGPIVLRKPDIVAINNESPIWQNLQTSKRIVLQVNNSGSESTPLNLTLVAQASEFLDVAAGAHYFVHVPQHRSLNMKTRITKAAGNHHYKFMLEEHMHHGIPKMTAVGSKLLEDGNTAGAKFDFQRFDHSRLGFVIDSKESELYCSAATCEYAMMVWLENIRILEVYIGEHIDFELITEGQSSVGFIYIDRLHQRVV